MCGVVVLSSRVWQLSWQQLWCGLSEEAVMLDWKSLM